MARRKANTHGNCPKCNHRFEFATSIDSPEARPSVGDISFCVNCGAVNQFGESGIVPLDLSGLDSETRKEVSRIKQAWIRTKKRMGD